jgi:hypothetical protein
VNKLRSVGLLAAGATVAVVLTPGSAVAGGAKSLLLGRANSTTRTTTVANTAGTPLALRAGHGKAPLTVNSGTRVANLNADRLDGHDSTSFASARGVTGIVAGDAPGDPATCPSGTVLTGGGGFADGGLLWSGVAFDDAGHVVKNSWQAIGYDSTDGKATAFAVCYSASGKAVPGAISAAQLRKLSTAPHGAAVRLAQAARAARP